jgi:transcriptional regulator with XRE-family HTH domain
MAQWYESGKELRKARKRLGLTQAQLAELAGVSQSLITAVERGVKSMAAEETRKRIANTLVMKQHERMVEMSATPKEKTQQLQMERDMWKAKANWAWASMRQLLKERDELRDILNLETTSAMAASEAMEKIKALGLQKRSPAEEEFRSELASALQQAQEKAE